MKLILSAVLAGVLCMLATGCSTVTTPVPLADPQPIDQEKFEGAWMIDDGILHIHFSTNGVAKIASVNWEDEAYKMGEAEMIVVKGKEHNYLSLRGKEDGAWQERYHLIAYTFADGGDLVVWGANVEAFKKLVTDQTLGGEVSSSQYSSNITLTDPPATLLEFLNETGDKMLFEYKKPTVLRKIISDGE